MSTAAALMSTAYMDGRFNRRSFDPVNNPSHKRTLETLRQRGSARARTYAHALYNPQYQKEWGHYDPTHFYCCGSSALQWLKLGDFNHLDERIHETEKEAYVDIGCGDSPDILIARGLGYTAYSVDLFPPFKWIVNGKELRNGHIAADALSLPFDDFAADYISSQAMVALIPERERTKFYKEICRVLKVGGWFSMTGAVLKCGYGYKQGAENYRARQIGWWDVIPTINGFCAQRVS